MLYRAFAYVHQSEQHEVTVFFESKCSETRSAALERLKSTLACVWGAPVHCVDFYNVFDERELLGEHAFGPATSGDARLLETGFGGEDPIHYAKPESTLLLVRPETLQRLVAAQQQADRLLRFHRTPRVRASLFGQQQHLREAA